MRLGVKKMENAIRSVYQRAQGVFVWNRPWLFPFLAFLLVTWLSGNLTAHADPFPPEWNSTAVHYLPAPWPSEPDDPAQCTLTCGEWKPYTRFQNDLNDPRTQDPSNGGTAPQNYVNVSSSCVDKTYPSIYYSLYKDPTDPSGNSDVIMFRWRVEQIANNYGTGPSPGNYSASDPWSSALWTVLFDVDGDGFRDLAAHLNGSSGSPSSPVDRLAGIWGNSRTQSIDYVNDPAVHLLAHNPTAFTSGSRILNFHDRYDPQDPLHTAPDTDWPPGSSTKSWDYGTTRAKLVSTNACNEYFVDYQIPVAMLNASSLGGPKITRDTPLSMMFCTANSLNNPFQKDCAIDRAYIGEASKAAPFGDYLSFNKDTPYAQPIVSSVIATPPSSCPGPYTLAAKVQDTLYVDANGLVAPSIKEVTFYYWYDRDGDGTTAGDGGSDWTYAATGVLKSGTLNTWAANWDATSLPKGKYLIGVQAVDDRTLHDDDGSDAPVDNRTFSYVTGDSESRIYVDGVQYVATLPSPPGSTTGENWYGNPGVTGIQTALVGVAINACGVAPELQKSASPNQTTVSQPVTFTLSVVNKQSTALTVDSITDSLPAGFSYSGTLDGSSSLCGGVCPAPAVAGTAPTWTFSSPVSVPGACESSDYTNCTRSLVFVANAPATAGTYNNTSSATTSFGVIASNTATVQVDSARISLSNTPDQFSISPGGSITYDLAYSNDSAVTVSGATLTDVLPAGVSCTAYSINGGTAQPCSGQTATVPLGVLAGGATGSVSVHVAVGSGFSSSSLANDATLTVTPPSGSDVQKTASSTVAVNVPKPAFTLTKTLTTPANVVQIAPSATVTWTIAYKNYGTAAASGVILTDDLPAGFTYSSSAGGGSNSNGTVTWNIGSVGVGASGTVTVTATAAPSPFTFPNPAVNNARIVWSGDATGVTSSNSVGVTGQYCSAVYYFYPGNAVSQTVPTATSATTQSFSLTNSSPGTIAFTAAPMTSALTINGQTLTVNFYLSSSTGAISFTVALNNLTQGTTIAQSTPATVGNTGGAATLYSFTASVNQNVNQNDILQWVFDFSTSSGASKNLTFYYDSTTNNSRSSFCTASAPASLLLVKTVDQASVASTGGTLNYVLSYGNSGGASATGVNLSDTLPSDVSCSQYTSTCTDWATPSGCSGWTSCSGGSLLALINNATLAGGASGHYAIQAAVGNNASGVLTNSAVLSGSGLTTATASASTSVAGGTPALTISKKADKTLLSAGDTVTYTLTVVNTGGTAKNVVVTDPIPSNSYFSYVPGSISGGDARDGGSNPLTWSVNSLAGGSSVPLTFQMRVASSGVDPGVNVLNNTAAISSYSGCTSNCGTSNTVAVSISGNPNLSIIKSAEDLNGGSLLPGDPLQYTLTVTNQGSSAADGVVVTDPIPANTSFTGSISASQGSGDYDAVNNQVEFNVGSLASGATATLSFRAVVSSSLTSGSTTITNTGTVVATNASARSGSASSSASAAPLLTLSKSGPASLAYPAATLKAAANGMNLFVNSTTGFEVGQYVEVSGQAARVTAIGGASLSIDSAITADVGEPVIGGVVYSLAYQNTGTADASDVVLTDLLPAGSPGLAFYSSSPDAAIKPVVGSSGAVTWNLGTLAPGAGGTVQVVAFPTGSGTTTNSASIACSEVATPVSDSVQTIFGGLSVTKSTSTPTASAPGTATYTITVRNSTAALINGVAVKDLLPSGFTYKEGSTLIDGSSNTASAVFSGQTTGMASDVTIVSNSETGAADGITLEADGSSTIDTLIAAWNASNPLESIQLAAGDGAQIPTSDLVLQGPAWTVDVPANGGGVDGSVSITFDVDIASTVGPATYQNDVEVTKSGVGITPFDSLATTAEDVTVLAEDTAVVEGYVFRDSNQNGDFDADESVLAGVSVTIVDQTGTAYVEYTDYNGYYRRVIAAGATLVDVSTLPGMVATDTNPVTTSVPSGSSRTLYTGFIEATGQNGIIAGTVFNDANGDTSRGGAEGGLIGVSVQLLDSGNNVLGTTLTGVTGGYSFGSVPVGTYSVGVVPPVGYGATTPNPVTNVDVVVNGTTTVDFGLQHGTVPTISGNAGIAGAALNYTDGGPRTAAADASGNYAFEVSANWSGTVTPSKAGFTFTPVSRSYANVSSDQTNQDYSVTPIAYTISGNAGVGGATLSYTDGVPMTATADASGDYAFTVSYNWSGTVMPSKTGFTFTPVSRSYANLAANQPDQNYTAEANNTPPTFVGSTLSLTVAKGSGAVDIKGLLHASDVDVGQTLTWSELTAPNHGRALAIIGATAPSGGTDVAPGGSITYTPAPGYSGSESFVVQVSDGSAADTRTISVKVNAPPTQGAVTAPDVSQANAGGNSYSFTVVYDDSDGTVSSGSIGTGNVSVTGHGTGKTLVVTSAAWNAATHTATYTAIPPGGSWDDADNGVYDIAVNPNQVMDNDGATVPSNSAAGSFTVEMDTTSPVVTGLTDDSTVAKSKTWTWSATDVSAVSYRYVIDQNSTVVLNGAYGASTTASQTTGDGTWYLHVQARDAAGNESGVVTVSVVLDNTAPAVTSIVRTDPPGPTTNASSVTFTVTFSEKVLGLSAANLSVPVVGITGSAITSVSAGVGNSWTVVVNTGTGDGTLGLDMVNTVNVGDAAGNGVAPLPFTGEQYNVIKSAPIVTSINRTTPPGPATNASTVTYTVAFSEPVTGGSATAFSLPTTGLLGASIASVASGPGDTWLVTVNTGTGDGTLGLNLVDGTNVVDAHGNHLAGVPFTGQVYTLDRTPPTVTLSSNAPDPTRLSPIPVTVTFSEPVTGFTAATLVVGNATVDHFSGSGSAYTLDLIPVRPGEVSVEVPANVATDDAGNANTAGARLTRTFDACSISGTVAGQAVKAKATIKPFETVVIGDSAPLHPLTVTLNPNPTSLGSFSPESLLASGFSTVSEGRFAFTGTAGQATASIRQLVFVAGGLDADKSATVSCSITVDDGIASPIVDTVTTLIISSANHAPVANDQSVGIKLDEPVFIKLTAVDDDGDPLVFTLLRAPVHGTLSGSPPDLQYIPSGWNWSCGCDCTDSFTFKANDGTADSNEATVTIKLAANTGPFAYDQSVTTHRDRPLPITLEGSDALGRALKFKVANKPAHGKLSGKAPNLVYTPGKGYAGPDSFSFKVSNGRRYSDLATVSINISEPVADAGPDQEVKTGAEIVLDGSNSHEKDGEIASFAWSQMNGQTVTLESNTDARATFTAPVVEPSGESLVFQLEVTDSAGVKSSDQCIVNIPLAHAPPVADAGGDQTVEEGQRVYLDGSQSSAEAGIASFAWTQIHGIPVKLSGPTTARPSFKASKLKQAGDCLIFQLRVTDNLGLISDASAIVNVVGTHEPPSAEAGGDKVVFEGDSVALDASASTDPLGAALSYRWTQLSGPPVVLSDPTGMAPTFAAPPSGEEDMALTFEVTVTNPEGLSSRRTCTVTVLGKSAIAK